MNQPPLKSTASNKASRELQFARSFKLEKLIPFECPGYFAVILTAITLLTLGLRLYRLDSESLYMDEIVTVETFHRDPVGIVLGAAIVGQPPLDNFVGAFVYRLGLGQSDWWVRFPAAVFGTGAVLLLGVWVRRLAGDVAGVTAALLLAVCPLHVYMSQEVRPYSLMFFLALACGLSYVRARERSTAVNWTLFSFVTFAMLMTRWTDPHFIILGIGLHALASRLRTTGADCELREAQASVFRRAALATVAAYACYAPFFCIVLHYHHSTSIRSPSNDWTVRFASLLYEGYAALLAGYSTRTVFHALPGSHWLLIAGGLLALLGLVAALLRRDAAPRDVKVFWWIFVPFPLVYAFVSCPAHNKDSSRPGIRCAVDFDGRFHGAEFLGGSRTHRQARLARGHGVPQGARRPGRRSRVHGL